MCMYEKNFKIENFLLAIFDNILPEPLITVCLAQFLNNIKILNLIRSSLKLIHNIKTCTGTCMRKIIRMKKSLFFENLTIH